MNKIEMLLFPATLQVIADYMHPAFFFTAHGQYGEFFPGMTVFEWQWSWMWKN